MSMWLRGEIFDHGLLHVAFLEREPEPSNASVGRAFDRIGRCLIALRTRGLGSMLVKGDFEACANMLRAVWNEAAEPGDRSITEDECSSLLQIFSILKSPKWISDRQAEAEFVLFLVVQFFFQSHTHLQRNDQVCWPSDVPEHMSEASPIQSFYSYSPSSSVMEEDTVMSSGHTPVTAASPRAASPRSLAVRAVSQESEQRLEFLRSHLRDIFWLLSLCDALSARSSFLERWNLQEISAHVVFALRFLITDQDNLQQVSPGQDTKTSCLELELQLGRSLTLNNDANPRPSQLLDPDVEMDEEMVDAVDIASPAPDSRENKTSDEQELAVSGRKRAPSLTVSTMTPANNVILANIRRRTVVEPDPTHQSNELSAREGEGILPVNKLAIFACRSSYIYALMPSKHVRIVGCTNSIIVLGPCAEIVTIEHCSNLEVMGITQYLTVGNSYDCKINVHTLKARPILFGDCRSLELGPFNTFYPRLNQHLVSVGIDPKKSFPSLSFLCLQPVDITVQTGSGSSAWTLLPPSDFTPFVVPLQEPSFGDACRDNPVGLPPLYAQALFQKVDRVESLLRRLALAYTSDNQYDDTEEESPKDDCDTPTGESKMEQPATDGSSKESTIPRRQQLERLFQEYFRDWLISTGNVRQVLDLVKLNASSSASSSFSN